MFYQIWRRCGHLFSTVVHLMLNLLCFRDLYSWSFHLTVAIWQVTLGNLFIKFWRSVSSVHFLLIYFRLDSAYGLNLPRWATRRCTLAVCHIFLTSCDDMDPQGLCSSCPHQILFCDRTHHLALVRFALQPHEVLTHCPSAFKNLTHFLLLDVISKRIISKQPNLTPWWPSTNAPWIPWFFWRHWRWNFFTYLLRYKHIGYTPSVTTWLLAWNFSFIHSFIHFIWFRQHKSIEKQHTYTHYSRFRQVTHRLSKYLPSLNLKIVYI